ncbi:hypothetical protein ACIRO1_17255 [Streptomyces sp. NPDC102381]|uniref:hypothetical protein n=1 Tax=Streptomyces sp. NPDC102381 TaxID=3366164 RepID=UPI003800594D
MPTAAETAAVTALVAVVNDTETDPEAALLTVLAQAARDSGLIPATAPYHPRDTPPLSVTHLLMQRATTPLREAFMNQRATGTF